MPNQAPAHWSKDLVEHHVRAPSCFNLNTRMRNSARHPAGITPVTSNVIHKPSGPDHERTIAKPRTRQTTSAVHHNGFFDV
jgi:hypothetical protein